MLNNITLMGRLVKDPELRYTNNQTPVMSVTVAVDRDFGKDINGNKITDFIDLVAWKSTAEFINKYFAKGQMIAVQGSIQNRIWEDKEGKNRRSTEVLVSSAYFGEGKKSESNVKESDLPQVKEPEFIETDEGDLPF